MISYAQNFEDVLLARVFRDQVEGFYVDVGAGNPAIDSVTKHFYDLGWRGINIEPLKAYFELLEKDRPRDINLNVALGDEIGERPFYNVGDGGGSTFVEEFAIRGERLGYTKTEEIVAITTLKDICDTHVRSAIDFLKIDVEGWERHVIEGGDWANYLPKVVLVEATEPNTPVPNFKNWEFILLDADYVFAYFDGLNRYYVRKEDRGLKKFFRVPVNFFDDFQLYPQVLGDRQVAKLARDRDGLKDQLADRSRELADLAARQEAAERQVAELTQDRDGLKGQLADRSRELADLAARQEAAERQVAELTQDRDGLKGQLEIVINSRSWRYTRIIRNISAKLKRRRGGSAVSRNCLADSESRAAGGGGVAAEEASILGLGASAPVVKTDLLARVRSELERERLEVIAATEDWAPDANRSPPRLNDLIQRQTAIDHLLSTIEDHLHQVELLATPRQALPERLKKQYFVFRLKLVERLILRIHHALFFDAHRGGQELANAMRLCVTALRHQSQQFGDLIRLTRKMSGK